MKLEWEYYDRWHFLKIPLSSNRSHTGLGDIAWVNDQHSWAVWNNTSEDFIVFKTPDGISQKEMVEILSEVFDVSSPI